MMATVVVVCCRRRRGRKFPEMGLPVVETFIPAFDHHGGPRPRSSKSFGLSVLACCLYCRA